MYVLIWYSDCISVNLYIARKGSCIYFCCDYEKICTVDTDYLYYATDMEKQSDDGCLYGRAHCRFLCSNLYYYFIYDCISKGFDKAREIEHMHINTGFVD